jgi:competence protein ComEA
MGDLKYKEQLELTSQQADGLAVMVALAVLLYVINILMPVGGSSATPAEPFSKREKGMLTIALNLDGQERGVYFMAPGATISDLMTAIRTTIPLELERGMGSRRLQTGDEVYLTSVAPALGTPFLERCPHIGKMSAAQSLALDLPVDINKAGLEDLVLVPGIGEKTAMQIIALREAKGSLQSLEELQELSGMREKKFDKLKKYLFALP